MEVGTLLDLLILGALAVAGLAWRSFSSGVEEAAKEQAIEAVTRINWPVVLTRELEKTRGTERQELRFESYGKLWAAMRSLAIYDESPFNRNTMKELSDKLSNWYFSETGGLMLTRHNRDLCFALQDLLRAVERGEEWEAERIDDPKDVFENLLQRRNLSSAEKLLRHLEEATPRSWSSDDLELLTREWREDVREMASGWAEMNSHERFAALQQVSRVLRTGLANDVESRLR